MTRILVTGWRDWPWEAAGPIRSALLQVLADRHGLGGHDQPACLVVGDCPTGVDNIAAWLWRHDDAVCIAAGQSRVRAPEVHRAYWRDEGKAAGPNRNQRMVAAGADIGLAFPGAASRGTWDCHRKAREAGIPMRVVEF